MMIKLDGTNDPSLKSWVESANQPGCPFPVQNLPYGVFSTPENGDRRVGVAIGSYILDLSVIAEAGLLPVPTRVFDAPSINAFMALGPDHWTSTRRALSRLLSSNGAALGNHADLCDRALVSLESVTLHMPIAVAGYTDFYASREHATNVGSMFRDPENALMPNWLHIPIGYNGRASTVVVSGTDVRRPLGQTKPPGSETPVFSPCRKLDIELEMGAVVGTSSTMGQPLTVAEADAMIFGYVLLNDWSARDIQVWEYQPLGPFQSKAFATTISPWVVTRDALAPFRVDGPLQTPEPLPYLRQSGPQNYDINLEVSVKPASADRATVISRTNFKHMYWSSAQQLAHHAVSGCAMEVGDLLGSGTISGAEKGSFGSLLELTWNGRDPLTLEDGSHRTFIEDQDTLTLRGMCQGDGYSIGFGEAAGTILPARSLDVYE